MGAMAIFVQEGVLFFDRNSERGVQVEVGVRKLSMHPMDFAPPNLEARPERVRCWICDRVLPIKSTF
jgi:hypothetical protein